MNAFPFFSFSSPPLPHSPPPHHIISILQRFMDEMCSISPFISDYRYKMTEQI
jgi:hypothetical protein